MKAGGRFPPEGRQRRGLERQAPFGERSSIAAAERRRRKGAMAETDARFPGFPRLKKHLSAFSQRRAKEQQADGERIPGRLLLFSFLCV